VFTSVQNLITFGVLPCSEANLACRSESIQAYCPGLSSFRHIGAQWQSVQSLVLGKLIALIEAD
jgi:hypothetical protein